MIEHLLMHGLIHLARHASREYNARNEEKLRRAARSELLDNSRAPSKLDLEALLESEFVVICDTCYEEEFEIETSWRITKKGNLRCRECGEKNDFRLCDECDCVLFRKTKRANYRCVGCDEKMAAPSPPAPGTEQPTV